MNTVLSIQSSVAAGHVGNDAAALPLQLQGFEVWAIPTVLFSNHPAHGSHKGRVLPAAEVAALLGGIEDSYGFSECGAVLSGYLGAAATGTIVARTVRRVRRANPAALYVCDPVFGDHGRRYVAAEVVETIRRDLVPLADILVPNAFEASELSGIAISGVADACRAATALSNSGKRQVVITGVEAGESLVTVVADKGNCRQIATPRIDHPAHGAGDLFAALLLTHLLRGDAITAAVSRAVSSVFGVVEQAAKTGASDLPLVATQKLVVLPAHKFTAAPI